METHATPGRSLGVACCISKCVMQIISSSIVHVVMCSEYLRLSSPPVFFFHLFDQIWPHLTRGSHFEFHSIWEELGQLQPWSPSGWWVKGLASLIYGMVNYWLTVNDEWRWWTMMRFGDLLTPWVPPCIVDRAQQKGLIINRMVSC